MSWKHDISSSTTSWNPDISKSLIGTSFQSSLLILHHIDIVYVSTSP
jgi:hypothetical protein